MTAAATIPIITRYMHLFARIGNVLNTAANCYYTLYTMFVSIAALIQQ